MSLGSKKAPFIVKCFFPFGQYCLQGPLKIIYILALHRSTNKEVDVLRNTYFQVLSKISTKVNVSRENCVEMIHS